MKISVLTLHDSFVRIMHLQVGELAYVLGYWVGRALETSQVSTLG